MAAMEGIHGWVMQGGNAIEARRIVVEEPKSTLVVISDEEKGPQSNDRTDLPDIPIFQHAQRRRARTRWTILQKTRSSALEGQHFTVRRRQRSQVRKHHELNHKLQKLA